MSFAVNPRDDERGDVTLSVASRGSSRLLVKFVILLVMISDNRRMKHSLKEFFSG